MFWLARLWVVVAVWWTYLVDIIRGSSFQRSPIHLSSPEQDWFIVIFLPPFRVVVVAENSPFNRNPTFKSGQWDATHFGTWRFENTRGGFKRLDYCYKMMKLKHHTFGMGEWTEDNRRYRGQHIIVALMKNTNSTWFRLSKNWTQALMEYHWPCQVQPSRFINQSGKLRDFCQVNLLSESIKNLQSGGQNKIIWAFLCSFKSFNWGAIRQNFNGRVDDSLPQLLLS